ncbi:hypothetical protein EV360DRAFT_74101 [Lentinula raphanica]|nr:hypothetical protein EV360DRAFT_74101 [Lentinula raphanica]
MIPSLPAELVVEIGERTPRLATKKNLRLTCSFLADVFKPHVLSTVKLDIYLGNTESGFSLLESLVEDSQSAQSTLCKHIRALHIYSLSPSYRLTEPDADPTVDDRQKHRSSKFWHSSKTGSHNLLTPEQRLQSLLEPALKALHHLNTLRWYWELKDYVWTYHTIMATIADSPLCNNLIEFSLLHSGSVIMPGGGKIPSLNLPNLRKLYLRANRISEVTFHDILPAYDSLNTLHIYRRGPYPPLLTDNVPATISDLGLNGWVINVPRIIHGNLTSLDLGETLEYINTEFDNAQYFTREDAFNSLWNALCQENIHLRSLAVPFRITVTLLDYLASYSGLESLAFNRNRDWSVGDCFDLAPRFYKDVMPMHRNTLTKLSLTPEFEDKWCFGEENIKYFAIMHKLRNLSVGVLTRGLDPDPLELPEHSVFRTDGFLPNSVHLLLGMISSSLPNLEKLSIMKAVGFDSLGDSSVTTKHNESIKRRLHASVQSFGRSPDGLQESDLFRWIDVYVEDEIVMIKEGLESESHKKGKKYGLKTLQKFAKKLGVN